MAKSINVTGACCPFFATQVLHSPKPPPVLAGHFDQTLYLKTQSYSLDKWWFALWKGLYSFFETLLMLSYGVRGLDRVRFWYGRGL